MESGEKPIVVFLGPKASYTHQATLSSFPEARYDIRPQEYIKDVFAAVQSGNASHGVVPFENSSNGSVIFTLDLFADLDHKNPDILVEGEIYLPVRHCLLGHRPKARTERRSFDSHQHQGSGQKRFDLPWRQSQPQQSDVSCASAASTTETPDEMAAGLAHITTLHSHPQAWDQCSSFLASHFPTAHRQNESSTSRAAELVAQDGSGRSAAIASRLAASLFQLDILAAGIEDDKDNTTRFFILSKRPSSSRPSSSSSPSAPPPAAPSPPSPPHAHAEEEEGREEEAWKTLLSFTVSHTSPGALADSLAVFKRHGLNLTSIYTRPSRVANWHYIFFVEIQGRREPGGGGGGGGGGKGGGGGGGTGRVEEALRELGAVAEGWRWLGSWESGLKAEGKVRS